MDASAEARQNVFRLSRRIVTGPALVSETSIIAWNSPVATLETPSAPRRRTKYS